MKALKLKREELIKHHLVGIGGIGTGIFLGLEGNETLGREESRSARLLNRRDYCKLHIISHYIQVFLGKNFRCLPIGKVGNDEAGKRLIKEMKDAGMNTRFISVEPDKPTLQSFCYVYPDKTGGNITLLDSACDSLSKEDILNILPKLQRYSNDAVALVVPEVPLQTRECFITYINRKMLFNIAASFTAGEILKAYKSGLFYNINILSVNYEEACALIEEQCDHRNYSDDVIKKFRDKVAEHNSIIKMAVTAGGKGSWFIDGDYIGYEEAFKTDVVSTAGAGDAFFAGLIIGWLLNLPNRDIHLFASLMGAASVTSEHTIHPELDSKGLLNFINKYVKNDDRIKNIRKLLER